MLHGRLAPDITVDLPFRIGTEAKAAPAALEAACISVVTERAQFEALEQEWNDLFERAGKDHQLFQTFNWNWHWVRHYLSNTGRSPRRTLAVVVARRDGRLVLVWPLVLERIAGLRVLQWMGDPVSQYGDVLVERLPDNTELLRQSWTFITNEIGADVVHLRKVRADAAVAGLLAQTRARKVSTTSAPYLDLASAPNFAGYEQRYNSKTRKNRRRLQRQFLERGPLTVQRHPGGPTARDAARAAIAMKLGWLGRTGRISPALTDPRFAAFFADVAEAGARGAGCEVVVLKSNGEPAGYAIDVTCGARRAAHVIVHDPKFDDFGAGVLLLQEWIRGACAHGIATFDLLAPAYAYKLDWADGAVGVEDFALGLTLRGRAFAGIYLGFARSKLKTALESAAVYQQQLMVLFKSLRRVIPDPVLR